MDSAAASPLAAIYRVPGLPQLLMLGGLAIAIAAGVTAAFYVREPSYTMLFGNVGQQEASEIMNALSGNGIAHKLDPKTGAILVSADQVQEARLKLASQGLPRGSGTGFGIESMQENGALGSSQFMENARYTHVLETELGRTISALRPVQSARVHLALPESSVFLRKRREPSASVLLSLYPGRELEKAQIASIVHLVASSIPGLEPERVTVVDQQGRLLNAPGNDSALGLSTQQFEYAEHIERSYTERIVNLLAPMLGPDRIRATVTADLDFTEREETREDYDPASTVVRSEQLAEDRASAGATVNGGVPGALSNTPPPPVVAANAANPTANSTASPAPADSSTAVTTQPLNESTRTTRNYEVNRSLSRTRQSIGSIRRLSVAVLVDHKRITDDSGETTTKPLSAEEIDDLTRLVKEAVGFEEKRGDSVNVSNISFYEKPAEEEPEEPGMFDSVPLLDIGRNLIAGALLIGLAFAIIRPVMRAFGNSAGRGLLPAGAAPGEGYAAAARAPLSFDDKVNVARQLADKNPERVAQIVKSWMQNDG